MDWKNFQLPAQDGSTLVQIVLRIDPLGGTHHRQSPLTMVGEFHHRPLLNTAPTTTQIRVSNPDIKPRANMLEEAIVTTLRERIIIISPSPLEKEDVTLAMTLHAT